MVDRSQRKEAEGASGRADWEACACVCRGGGGSGGVGWEGRQIF